MTWIRLSAPFLFVLFFCRGFSLPVNQFRGDGIWFSREVQDEALFLGLHQKGFRHIFFEGGKIHQDLRTALFNYPVSEEFWKNKYSFHNWLSFSVMKLRLDQIQGAAEILISELKRYGGRFDGILIDFQELESSSSFHLVEELKKNKIHTGILLSLETSTRFKPESFCSPDFFLVNMPLLKKDSISWLIPVASKWNRPWMVSFSFEPVILGPLQEEIPAGDLSFVSLKEVSRSLARQGGLLRELIPAQKFEKGDFIFEKGAVINLWEPPVEMISNVLAKASLVDSFWFCGAIVNTFPYSIRTTMMENLKIRPPQVLYRLEGDLNRPVLSLTLENPNPVSSRNDIFASGIGLQLKGFRVVQMDVREAMQFKTVQKDDENMILFYMDDLKPYSRSGSVQVELEKTSDLQEIRTIGWLRPQAFEKNIYDPGGEQSEIPEFVLTQKSHLLFASH